MTETTDERQTSRPPRPRTCQETPQEGAKGADAEQDDHGTL